MTSAARPSRIAGLYLVLVLNGFGTTADEVARRQSLDFLRTIDSSATLVAAADKTTDQAISIGRILSSDVTLSTAFPNTTLGNQLWQVAKVIKFNALAPELGLRRQIFFCQLGELRDRTFENQAYRASGLNLVVAAVILWNTRYLQLAADDLGVSGEMLEINCYRTRRHGYADPPRSARATL